MLVPISSLQSPRSELEYLTHPNTMFLQRKNISEKILDGVEINASEMQTIMPLSPPMLLQGTSTLLAHGVLRTIKSTVATIATAVSTGQR